MCVCVFACVYAVIAHASACARLTRSAKTHNMRCCMSGGLCLRAAANLLVMHKTMRTGASAIAGSAAGASAGKPLSPVQLMSNDAVGGARGVV